MHVAPVDGHSRGQTDRAAGSAARSSRLASAPPAIRTARCLIAATPDPPRNAAPASAKTTSASQWMPITSDLETEAEDGGERGREPAASAAGRAAAATHQATNSGHADQPGCRPRARCTSTRRP